MGPLLRYIHPVAESHVAVSEFTPSHLICYGQSGDEAFRALQLQRERRQGRRAALDSGATRLDNNSLFTTCPLLIEIQRSHQCRRAISVVTPSMSREVTPSMLPLRHVSSHSAYNWNMLGKSTRPMLGSRFWDPPQRTPTIFGALVAGGW